MKENEEITNLERFELLIEDCKGHRELYGESCVGEYDIEIMQHLLSDYRIVLKENEELLEIKVSTSAHNRILELEKENEELKAEMKDGVIGIKLYALQTENEKLKEKIDFMENYMVENGKTCNECIKQYFENKAKEVE